MVEPRVPAPSSAKTSAELGREREAMVAEFSRQGVLRSEAIRRAVLSLPREEFVPAAWRDHAYEEVRLPLPSPGATMSGPRRYPELFEALGLEYGHRYLQLGIGSGFGAALAAEVVGASGTVVCLEIDHATLAFARANLKRAGYSQVLRLPADGALGHPPLAPYDRICVTAACDDVPSPLLEQLAVGGRLIAPITHDGEHVLTLIEKASGGLRSVRLAWSKGSDTQFSELLGEFAAHGEPAVVPALLVTCHDLRDGWRARIAVRRALPDAWVSYTPFRGILLVESEGDPEALAARLTRARGPAVARVNAVLSQVPSTRDPMMQACLRAARNIGPGQTFAVRIHKRGSHGYLEPTLTLERLVGAAVRHSLEERDGIPPRVALEHPDVIIDVEVLGPRSLICLRRGAWTAPPSRAPDGAPAS
jgi:protein-L-isoaspartate(D-aspartate) O-methyltransferase